MDSLTYNYAMEEKKPIFTTANETTVTSTTDTFAQSAAGDRSMSSAAEAVFSPLAPSFQTRGGGNDMLNFLAQQEPRVADNAPTAADMEEILLNYRLNSNLLFDDNEPSTENYFLGDNNRAESEASTNLWSDGAGAQPTRNGDMLDTFDFLVKSLSSANNYVSMLTREQLSVLRSIRPNLLYELLLEVAKIRSDKRMRRALPNECAFCKNNGENEECYSQHALKDWRGRVLCPVLRAFRCPRCGATGDRAHTIKYCPENGNGDGSSLGSRRRVPPSSLVLGPPLVSSMASTAPRTPHAAPAPPTPTATTGTNGLKPSPWWCNYE